MIGAVRHMLETPERPKVKSEYEGCGIFDKVTILSKAPRNNASQSSGEPPEPQLETDVTFKDGTHAHSEWVRTPTRVLGKLAPKLCWELDSKLTLTKPGQAATHAPLFFFVEEDSPLQADAKHPGVFTHPLDPRQIQLTAIGHTLVEEIRPDGKVELTTDPRNEWAPSYRVLLSNGQAEAFKLAPHQPASGPPAFVADPDVLATLKDGVVQLSDRQGHALTTITPFFLPQESLAAQNASSPEPAALKAKESLT